MGRAFVVLLFRLFLLSSLQTMPFNPRQPKLNLAISSVAHNPRLALIDSIKEAVERAKALRVLNADESKKSIDRLGQTNVCD